MDSFVSVHTSNSNEGPTNGTDTMGYYQATDIPFMYTLANKFTVCDGYHCSVLGPTHPNRMLWMTGTLDPAGTAGGPILVTNPAASQRGSCTWATMPEALTDAGVSWHVYNPFGPFYSSSGLIIENVLACFAQYQDACSSSLNQNAFSYYGPNVPGGLGNPNGPDNFSADVAAGTLPSVSWIIPPIGYDQHPPGAPTLGEWYIAQVLQALLANPTVWTKTALYVSYDENDGFFDHVSPPTPPAGTPGEFLSGQPPPTANANGVAGPIGLGVRVPMDRGLAVQPWRLGVLGHVRPHVAAALPRDPVRRGRRRTSRPGVGR